jgi:hypothetical protein
MSPLPPHTKNPKTEEHLKITQPPPPTEEQRAQTKRNRLIKKAKKERKTLKKMNDNVLQEPSPPVTAERKTQLENASFIAQNIGAEQKLFAGVLAGQNDLQQGFLERSAIQQASLEHALGLSSPTPTTRREQQGSGTPFSALSR